MLAPETVQIHFADLQDGIVDAARTADPASIRRAAAVLAETARLLGLPASASVAPRPGGAGPIAEVAAVLPDLPVLVRTGPCAWDDPGVREAVAGHRRPVLVLAGVTTEIVVQHTALDALAAGHEVLVPVDACGGLTDRTERAALDRIRAAGGQVTSVAAVLTDLVRDFTTPLGRTAVQQMHRLAG